MSRSSNAPSSLRLRLAPTLLALCLMGSPLMAADPVFSSTVNTTNSATFTVTWPQDVGGWDPLYQDVLNVTGAASAGNVAIGGLHLFTGLANSPTPNPLLVVQPAYVSGTATGGSATTLVMTGAGWAVNAYVGLTVSNTTDTGSTMVITSNDATTLTGTAGWAGGTTNLAANTDTFTIGSGLVRVAPLKSMITASTTKSTTFAYALTGSAVKLFAAVPASKSYNIGSADPAQNSAVTQLVYTQVPTATSTNTTISAPVHNSTWTTRNLTASIAVNLDDDESVTAGVPINTLFSTAANFTILVKDGATLVGSAIINKKGIAWSIGAPTANRQNVSIPLDGPLAIGAHTLNVTIIDPTGVLVTASTKSTTVMLWDRPTLQVNGVSMLPGTILTSNRTNSQVFSGSKFNIGSDSSTVTLTVDGSSTGVTQTSLTDKTKFEFLMTSLVAGGHTLVLTQSYSGSGVSGSPSIISTYTVNNSTPDTAAPLDTVISVPSNGETVLSLTPVISGQGEVGATVVLRLTPDLGSVVTLTGVVVGADGFFTATSATLTANRTYSIETNTTDANGNASGFITTSRTFVTPAAVVIPTITVGGSGTTGVTDVSGNKYSATGTVAFTVNLTDLAPTSTAVTGPVAGLLGTDFVVTNGTIAASPAPVLTTAGSSTLTFSVIATAAGTPTTVMLPSNAFTVTSTGIANENSNTYTFTKDATVPTYTMSIINNGVTSTGATGSISSGTFDVVLTGSELLSAGGGSSDASIVVGLVGGTGGSIAKSSGGSGLGLSADKTKYTVRCTVTLGTANTGISITTASNAVTDFAGNPSAANAVAVARTFDTTAPLMSNLTFACAQATVGKVAPLVFTATFLEAVTGVSASSFDIQNGVVQSFVAAPTGLLYTLTVMPGEGPTPVKATLTTGTLVKDLAGNTLTTTALFLNRTYDSTPPRVLSMSSSTPSPTSTDDKPTNLASIPCSITFSEPVAGMAAGVFQVENGTVSNFVQTNPSLYRFNIDVAAPLTANKKVRVVLPAAAGVGTVRVLDPASNGNSSNAVLVRNFDGVAPTLNFAAPSPTGTGGLNTAESKVTFVININQATTPTTSDVPLTSFDKSQIIVNGGTIESIASTNSSAPSKLLTVTAVVIFPRAPGNVVTVTALPGTITDAAGNQNASTSMQYIVPAGG